ncbi:MAG: hypothetical protein JXX29_18740 [Deltaproteobacteria bacterium]|nr:hypothetical protein [Deltaproteobacteria bacterium]MBN2673724.1 hypothetical protein [Deltaproteobacteria bacterium]
MNSKSLITIILSALLALFVFACDDDDSSKASMDDILPSSADNESLDVTIDTLTNTGSMGFDVSGIDTSDDAVEAFGEYLQDGTISVQITSNETLTAYDVTAGTYVTGTPSAPGEYTYSVANDSFIVNFYNEYNGATLDPNQDYFATITVHENKYFDAGVYNVDISLM